MATGDIIITLTPLQYAEYQAAQQKANTLDALAARLSSGDWLITSWPAAPSINGVRITITATGERFSAERLADAVRMAMESEDR